MKLKLKEKASFLKRRARFTAAWAYEERKLEASEHVMFPYHSEHIGRQGGKAGFPAWLVRGLTFHSAAPFFSSVSAPHFSLSLPAFLRFDGD